MAYDYTMVPAGFQDLIPNNDQNKQQNAQNVADNVQNAENNAQNVPVVAQSQPDDFYLNVFGGARAAEENFAETQKYAETEAPIVADKIKKGNIYRKYLATQPEVLAQAKEMAGRLQIPVESITKSTEDFEAAVKMDNRYKKLLAISPTDEKQFTLDELYSEYPELLKLKSDTDGAIALHNIENVKLIKGVTEAAEKGWESRKLQREYSSIALAAYEGKELTEADKKRLADIRVAQNQMLRYAPEFLDNPMAAISYGTVEQGAMMGEQTAKTQVYAIPLAALVGTGVTAVSGPVAGAAAAKTTWATATKWGTGVEMFKETVGGYYLDYKEYVDKNGKQLLTDNEARVAATLAAAGEAYLEVANFDKILDMLKGTPAKEEAKEIIGGIVANAADKASFKAQLAYYMKNRFGKAVAAGWSEIKEEGEQAVYTDIVHNLVAAYKPNGNLKMMSASEIAEDAWDNMWQAVPSVVGMTGAGHVASGSMYVNKLADWLSAKHEDVLAAQRTAGGINMIEQLATDIKNSDMAKNSRDVYDQLVTNSVEGTQYQNVVVDTALLLENDPNGENSQVFYQLADAKGLNQSEADELKGSKMSIPIAQYLNVVEDDAVREKLRTLISFTEKDDCFARIQDNAKRFRKEFDQRVAADYEKVAGSIENWVKANIQGEEEQAMMTQVLFEYMDPKEGVKEIKKQYQEELDGLLKNTLDNMRSGMKQGVTFLFTDDDGNAVGYGQGVDAHIGGATRISNNDRWYSEYYKENKKAPSEKEMKRIAREALMGNNPYGIVTDTLGLTGDDLAEAEQQYKERFDTIDNVLGTLEKLEPVVENMDVSELKSMEDLSPEAIECYKAAKEFLLKSNGDVRKAAAASAIILAHHYEVLADQYRKMGQNVTPKELMEKRIGLGSENKAGDGMLYNQQQAINLGTELTIQRPAKEVLNDYNEFESQEYIELETKNIIGDSVKDLEKQWNTEFQKLYPRDKGEYFIENKYHKKVLIGSKFKNELDKHFYKENNFEVIPHLKTILERSVFLFASNPNPKKKKRIDEHTIKYETYGTKVKLGDNEYCCKTVLRLDSTGVYYLYDMDIENEKTKDTSLQAGSPESISGPTYKDVSLIENSIPWWRKEVKEKLLNNTTLQQRVASPEKTLVAYHNVLFQAAGQNAMTANLPNLEKAMAAYEAGKSAEDIYKATGWHIGMDGKWRFEIPDNLDLIDASKFPTTNHGVRLEEIYPNKALYKAYPRLADILVVGEKLQDKTYGYTDSKNGVIALNTKFIGNKTRYTIKFGNSTYTKQEINGEAETYVDENGRQMPLVVERAIKVLNTNKAVDKQNYVAMAIQGLEYAIERSEDVYENAVNKGADQETIFRIWNSLDETKATLEYIKSLGSDFRYEMEVLAERDDAYTHKNLDGTLIHEIQHLIQDKEGFAVGGNTEAVQKQIVRQKEKTLEAMKDIHPNAWDVYLYHENIEKAFIELDFAKIDQVQKDFDWIVGKYKLTKAEVDRIVKLGAAYRNLEKQEKEKDNTVKYFHLHGEQEARLASSKAELATQIAEGKDNFEKGYDNILKEWSKDKSEELKAKGERLAELEKAANDIDDSAEWTDAMEEEYEELSSMDELLDLADELSNQSLQNFRYLGLLDKYEREVLSTIDYNNTIVVFGGGAVAASTINPNATKIQAQVDVKATGEHIITLFESADQSTFMHEMAHVFYDDLRDLAAMENAPEQVKRDWNNLKMWTAWKDGQLEEYKGTATYNEFKELDAAIRQAQETGSGTYMNQEWSLQSLLNRWEQERFARGFEVYLEEGKAPTKALRGAFSKFKAWLTKIYKAVTGAGAKPSDQVRKIMDRMIATQEEIDNAMEEASLDALEKKGLFKYLSGSSQDMWTKNLAEIKEDVSAKVLKIAMKDMTAKAKEDRAEQIKAEREAAYERISQEPVFVAYQYLKQNPNLSVSDVVETMTDLSVEEYAAELKARGGSLEGAVNQYMETYETELKEPSNKKEIRAAAEQAISESHYTKLALAFEIQALEKFVLEEEALARKLDAINKQEKKNAEANDKAQRLLNYIERKQGKEHRIYRDSLEGYVQKIEKYAAQKMAGMAISEATNPAMWKKMAEENADDSLDSFAKVEYGLATKQKRIAFFYHTMAELAEKNKKVVESRVKTLMAHTKTMMKEKNVSANDRYLYNHLMYCFGLANKDVIKPPGYPASYMDVLLTYNENLEISYVDEDGNIDLPDWLTTAMSAESGTYKYKDGYTSLRMDELQLLYNVMENIYKAGRDAKALKTTRDAQGKVLTVDEVVGDIIGQAMDNVALLEEKDPTGMESENWWEATKRKANEAHVSLLKAETILRQLGDKAVKYIYNPIKVAADNEMVETEILTRNIRGITEAYHDSLVEMYSNQGVKNPEAEANKAMKELRTKKLYRIGTSNLTKEELICVALNWGTDINRKRVLEGHDVSQSQVEKALANLNSADWQMIMNIWKLFDEYWPRLVEVEANISGVVLEKQEAVPFSIMDNTGFAYNLPGGYYPIKYDRHKNKNVGNQASDEAVRAQLSGATRLGMGLGNTKERMETVKYKLRLDFGVFQESLGDTIHNICMREAVRDVYRVIRDKNFNDFIVSAYGNATANMLENWALDCWKKAPQVKGTMETVARWVREKQTVASLGFRTTTALLNICNISYVFDYLGAIRAVDALKTFYAHPREQFDFAMEKSVFLRDRAETMDRDMGDVLKRQKQNPGEGYVEAIQSASFKFITATDLMLACPMWISEYQRVYQESMDKKLSPEHAEREAVLAGDAAVRRVFGSGQIQDQAKVQKGNEFEKIFTMYYSFFSVVHNALMMKVFESRQAYKKSAKPVFNEDGTIKGMERDYKEAAKALVPIAEGVLYWMIIPAAMEACIRSLGSGDDKDKEAKNLAKKTFATTVGSAVGGIPLLREAVPAYLEWVMGGRYYGVSGNPIGDVADQVQRVMSGIKSGKKPKLDVARDTATVISSVFGLPKTMLDAMITAAQFIDHGKLTVDDIRHYLWAVMYDKNPDKKK